MFIKNILNIYQIEECHIKPKKILLFRLKFVSVYYDCTICMFDTVTLIIFACSLTDLMRELYDIRQLRAV